jgi:hypothetical protein
MKLSNETKLEMYKTKCKDLTTINGYIQYYQQFTRSTVENILKLSCLINEMKEKEKSGELNQSDVDYFCLSVGLNRKGSTFRKFEQIGKHSETFWKYIDKLPDSYTVLYEITTLDPDKFEELMSNNKITSYVTLKDIKRLGGKVTPMKQLLNPTPFNGVTKLNYQSLKKLCKSINQFTISLSRCIPEKDLNEFIKLIEKLQTNNYIQFNHPQIMEYVNDDEVDNKELITV